MKRSIRLLILPAVLLGTTSATAEERPNFDAYFDSATAPVRASAARITAASADGVASTLDPKRGVPTFLWAGKQQPTPPLTFASSAEGAALFYVGAYAHRWNLPASITDSLELAHIHDTGRGGIVVTFRQRFGGIEVFRGEVKALLARNFELIALSGTPASRVKGKGAFKLTAADAISRGLNNLYGIQTTPADIVTVKKEVADYRYFDLSPAAAAQNSIRLGESFRVKKVYFAMPTGMVPAFWFEIIASKAGHEGTDVFAYVIAADDGRLLLRTNLTENDAFKYRVWADPDGRPLDGPIAEFSPHPTGLPDTSAPAYVAPILMEMEGFNKNPSGQPDSWLPSSAKQTLGNNVDAYTDDGPGPATAVNPPPDGFSNGDMRATLTAPLTFDRLYDVNLAPLANPTQSMAAATQLFYDNNWLHDWFYDSGFNEAAGNAQQNNYGRGGLGGDVLQAQAQDGAAAGSRNNANMSTPADGTSPRMQMFVWDGINTRSLVDIATGLSVDTDTASFGAINFSLTGTLALADDATSTAPTGTPTDGCEAFVNNVVAGKIALVDRGSCGFAVKAKNAQNAGAIGVIIANNAANVGAPGLGGADPTVTIPVLSTTREQGVLFKTALLAGPVNVKMDRVSGIERDGTIDNTIVAHEWGHYIHHRLVNCGLNQCRGQSEGWGDFTALQMVLRPGDDLDGLFALSQYSTATFGPNYGYFGIRRAPYTTDMTKNGFTFGQITDGVTLPTHPLESGGAANAEVHNVGEIWASMMFEAYVAMLKPTQLDNPSRTFEQARRAMSDYVVAGMKLTPVEPDFNEQRNSILAAVYANDPADMMLFANAFAKRGLGTCAVSPPKDTETNAGAVESFSVQGNFQILSLDVDDSVSSCDNDGILDAEEAGKVTVKVMNTGVTMLAGTTVTIASTTAGVVFPNGATLTLPTLEPFAVGTATIDIGLDASVKGSQLLDLSAAVNNVAGCMATLNRSSQFGINYDNLTNAANIDTVESDLTAWKIVGVNSDEVWARSKDNSGNHAWHGVDYSSLSDTSLESPMLDVSATAPLVLSFSHRYSFEVDPTTNWDAGVIEVSSNGGAWVDISTYVDPGYGGVVNKTASNPLMNRQAFVGANAAYPASELLSLNFGTKLAGKKIKVRFRIGTDLGAGDFGWEIDNIVVQGITNTPFTAVGDDTTNCDHAPTANAGPDQMVSPSVGVVLDGSASADADADPLTFAWKQTAGPLVPIVNPTAQKPTFLAPPVLAATTLTFELDVSDGTQNDKDSVDVIVQPIAMTTGTGGAGGAGGDTSTATGTGSATGTSTATSSATSAAQSTSTGAGGNGGEDSGPITGTGCDCTTSGTGSTPSRGAFGASLLGAALFFARRRRNGR